MTATLEDMAREAGADIANPHFSAQHGASFTASALARFAALVRADERERCALVCISIADVVGASSMGARRDAGINTANSCAAAIRALEPPPQPPGPPAVTAD